jgi:1-acyl-sn-glycerol-3-phosphate acyltransferase
MTTPLPPKFPYKFRGEGSGLFQKFLWNAGALLSKIISMLMFRLHVRGQATIPKSGGVLLATNHQSFLDPWLIGIAPPRQVHYMARDTLFKGGFLHWLMETLNAFPVKRGTADLGAIRAAVERLDKGFMVNVFPEGTRSEDGTIGPVAAGFSLILNRAKTPVPIVPVLIDGAFDAWPRKAKFPRPGRVRITYGRPIPPEEWRLLSADDLARRIRRELVQLQEEMGSRYATASRQRLEADEDRAAEAPARPRRSRRQVSPTSELPPEKS